jgi:hypothetical protein
VQFRQQALKLIAGADGLKVTDIANLLGISIEMAKLVVRPLVGEHLEVRGIKRGAKYYVKGKAGDA